jgi:NDP-sugar pyrophosphorylase family protein
MVTMMVENCMNEQQAKALAEVFSGEAWDSGGGIWLAAYWRGDGKYMVFSGDALCEYDSEEDFDEARAAKTIVLASGDEEWWVVADTEGNTIYRNPDLQTGWRFREDAEHEAKGLESRIGHRFFARSLDT